jgi:chemotaxis protein CheX
MRLDPELHGDNARSIVDQLLAHRGKPLAIDATQVNYVDTPCIEVFVSAAKLWRNDGNTLEFGDLPEQFAAALAMLGLSQTDIESKESLT